MKNINLSGKTLGLLIGGLVLATTIALLVILDPGKILNKEQEAITYNPAFDHYISAYTEGAISKKDHIIVRFQEGAVSADEVGNTTESELISFNPSISGEASWIDTRTLKFIPEAPMPSNTVFTASVYLDDIFDQVPDSLSTFRFQFHSMLQDFNVQVEGIGPVNDEDMAYHRITGRLTTNDYADTTAITKILEATHDEQNLNITWTHEPDAFTHTFLIDSIARTEKGGTVTLSWNGKPLEVDKEGERTLEISALDDFHIVSTYARSSPEQYVVIEFSDPLDKKQSLEGLIELNGIQPETIIEGNKIKIFPQNRIIGTSSLKVSKGIKNKMGYPTEEGHEESVAFSRIKPEVKISDNGVIMPQSEELPFAFETVNLNAVDVRIIKIPENNIPQFLQVNNLRESDQLRRVGKVVINKKIDLNLQNNSASGWHEHVLDLQNLIRPEPGAIYEVALGFRQSYSTYPCEEDEIPNDEDTEKEASSMLKTDNWGSPDGSSYSYWDYYYGGSYSNRNNPCARSYYNRSRAVSSNVLASSIGLIVKKDQQNNLHVAAADIRSTEVLSDVELEVYDYQQQLMTTANTDEQGLTTVAAKETPFLIIAKKGNERGYLRIDDGNALSTSRFNVSGASHQKGVNGFFYGERGVWRPGDTLHLSFILEDKNRVLPEGHPITFEVTDPQGKVVHQSVHHDALNGFYYNPVGLKSDAPTGNYRITAKLGGHEFAKTLKVETIRPNRLKIKLDFENDRLLPDKSKQKGTLHSEWLHGAKAGNLKADIKLSLNAASTSFKGFDQYTFDDPTSGFSGQEKTVFEGKLDANGNATISPELDISENAPGMLRASFKTKVFEPGGAFSSSVTTVPYHPYDTYVGINTPKGDEARGMLLTDTDHNINFVTVDPDGKKVGQRNVDIKLYKLRWQWWWDQSSGDASYFNTEQHEAIAEATVRSTDGNANWKMNVEKPQWGRFLIRACDSESGHCTGKVVYIDWPGWAGRSRGENTDGASMLTFAPDKEKYNVGEEVTVNVPSSAGGRMLVSIENGTKVLDKFWKKTEKGNTRISFDATRAMTPNAYVHISLLQPHAQTLNDRPIRMYGIMPVVVEDPGSHLHPQLEMPDELKPESTVRLTVGEKDQKAMTYTIAMVDEGLLDLTNFNTPAPWQHFNQKQALGVKTWDLYNDIVAAREGYTDRLLSLGGGAMNERGAKKAGGDNINRFKPMVRFLGPFHINDGEQQSHKIDIPNYVGSVRTMVIAGYDQAYGSTEKTTPVRQPLMVLGAMPRVLGPGETLDLPVTLFAMKENVGKVDVNVKVSGAISLTGKSSDNTSFTTTGDKILHFPIKAKETTGKATIDITATNGKEKATHQITFKVRNPNPWMTDVYQQRIAPGDSWEQSFDPVGMAGTNKTMLEVSSIPPLHLGKRMNYLIRYPYGCVEQTTSAVFPQVYMDDLLQLSPKQKKDANNNIRAGISRLEDFQQSSGGFSYWPGGEVHPWGNNYAGHFLLEAKRAGYTIHGKLIENWLEYQHKKAREWNASNERSSTLTQSYRLFLLALANEPELGAMNRFRLSDNNELIGQWYLAGAYYLAGQQDIASNIAGKLNTKPEDYNELSGTFGSGLRDKAIILQIMSIMNRKKEAKTLLDDIAAQLSEDKWYSTQTTAYAFIAISEATGNTSGSQKMQFAVDLNGESFTKEAKGPLWQYHSPVEGTKQQSLSVNNTSSNDLFVTIITEGQPLERKVPASANGLLLNVRYEDMNGAAVSPSSIAQGTDFKAIVRVKNTSSRLYEELAIDQIFPSGWEILNTRLNDLPGDHSADQPTYRDIRDDRVYTFFDLEGHQEKTFTVLVNATFKGRYYHPPVAVSAMYDERIHARNTGKWINIEE